MPSFGIWVALRDIKLAFLARSGLLRGLLISPDLTDFIPILIGSFQLALTHSFIYSFILLYDQHNTS